MGGVFLSEGMLCLLPFFHIFLALAGTERCRVDYLAILSDNRLETRGFGILRPGPLGPPALQEIWSGPPSASQSWPVQVIAVPQGHRNAPRLCRLSPFLRQRELRSNAKVMA